MEYDIKHKFIKIDFYFAISSLKKKEKMPIITSRTINGFKDDEQFVFPIPITHLEPHPISTLINFLIRFPYKSEYYNKSVRFNDNYFDENNSTKLKVPILIKERKKQYYNDGILLNSELDRIKREIEEKDEYNNRIINKFNVCIYEYKSQIQQNIRDCCEWKNDEIINNIDRLEHQIGEMNDEICDLETKYKRELSKKEKRLDEYEQDDD